MSLKKDTSRDNNLEFTKNARDNAKYRKVDKLRESFAEGKVVNHKIH